MCEIAYKIKYKKNCEYFCENRKFIFARNYKKNKSRYNLTNKEYLSEKKIKFGLLYGKNLQEETIAKKNKDLSFVNTFNPCQTH